MKQEEKAYNKKLLHSHTNKAIELDWYVVKMKRWLNWTDYYEYPVKFNRTKARNDTKHILLLIYLFTFALLSLCIVYGSGEVNLS